MEVELLGVKGEWRAWLYTANSEKSQVDVLQCYKQPLVIDADLVRNMGKLLNILEAEKVDFIVCEDRNVNVLNSNHCLIDVLCVRGVKNVASNPTCVKNWVAQLQMYPNV